MLAAVAAGIAFTLTLRARYRDAFVMSAATVLALTANEVGETLFGNDAAAFVAALTVGVAGGLAGHRLRRSPLVFIVPGVLMLVPGSAGFNSILQLLSNQTVSGIRAGFDTFVTAMSIAYGLMVSSLVLPRRFTSVTSTLALGRTTHRAPGDSQEILALKLGGRDCLVFGAAWLRRARRNSCHARTHEGATRSR